MKNIQKWAPAVMLIPLMLMFVLIIEYEAQLAFPGFVRSIIAYGIFIIAMIAIVMSMLRPNMPKIHPADLEASMRFRATAISGVSWYVDDAFVSDEFEIAILKLYSADERRVPCIVTFDPLHPDYEKLKELRPVWRIEFEFTQTRLPGKTSAETRFLRIKEAYSLFG